MSGLTDIFNLPIEPPPPGVHSDFTSSDSTGNTLIIVGSIFLAFMVFFFTVRIYTKLFVVRATSWDDCKYLPLSLLPLMLTKDLDTCIIGFVRPIYRRIVVPN